MSVGVALAVPGDNAGVDEIVHYYHNLLYTTKEICGFLLLVHNIIVSQSTVKRVKRRLNLLRRHMIQRTPIRTVINAIMELRRQGLVNVGYREMWRRLNILRGINVSQETVRVCMREIDGHGVNLRSRNRLVRRQYYSRGPNYLIHVDGYDKLKPYGIAIHGAVDGFSRKVLWLKAGPSNNDPRYIAHFYMNFIKNSGRVPKIIRSDAGTENVIMRDLHIALRMDHGDDMSGRKSFLTGRSTANQRIERLWGVLNIHFTQFWRNFFAEMRDSAIFNDSNLVHIECIRYCFLPVIQTQLNSFMESWNSHSVRAQRQNQLLTPTGKPDVLYFQPELFETIDNSLPLPCTYQALDELTHEFTKSFPFRGCSEDFINIVSFLTNLTPNETPAPQTFHDAFRLFCALLTVCDYLDN